MKIIDYIKSIFEPTPFLVQRVWHKRKNSKCNEMFMLFDDFAGFACIKEIEDSPRYSECYIEKGIELIFYEVILTSDAKRVIEQKLNELDW